MNFHNTWQELDEIYNADFTTTGSNEVTSGPAGLTSGLLYHFYEDLPDLLNSLETGVIYSTKNDKEANKAQFDFSLEDGDGRAYVCMTNSDAGKQYMIKSYHRPFGISFDANKLEAACKSKGSFIRGFSAFGTKGDYTMVNGKPSLLAQTSERGTNPFIIYAIGEIKDGVFFISGGQGMNKLWASQLFYDEQLYQELKNWFMSSINTGDNYQKRMFYHFKDGKVHSDPAHPKLVDAKGNPVEADLNLNTAYKARRDFTKDGSISYSASMCFNFTGTHASNFKEVLGYGPLKVLDTQGNELLKLTAVNSSAKTGYRGPLLYGKNIATGTFTDKSTIFKGRKNTSNAAGEEDQLLSVQQHLMASEELFQKLCQVYNEYEYRIYLPGSQDFTFAPSLVHTLVLPEIFKIAATKEEINLRLLIDRLATEATVLSNPEALKADGIINTQIKKALPSAYAVDLVASFIEMLLTTYKDVGVELIPNTHDSNTMAKAKATIGTLQKTGEADVGVPLKKDGSIQTKDHARKVIDTWPDLTKAQVKPGQGQEPTVTAPVFIKGIQGEPEARIGSEAIIIAEDEKHDKYVLFVYKSKSPMFMELPGGGFWDIPHNHNEFKTLLLDKLKLKCDLNPEDITDPQDTNKALLLYEVGVAQDKSVTWPWSYYRLYSAKLTKPLSGETLADLGYSFTNTDYAKAFTDKLGFEVHSYRAHLRWVPVKHITLNRAITDRYSNIIPIIQELAK
jgi:hypothetical protein